MTAHRLVAVTLLLAFAGVSLAAASPPILQDEWKPVDPAHLALKAATVEKDADAEALFWEVRVQPDGDGAVLSHYIRIKVFTERGRESQSKVELPFFNNNQIKDITGRTIKPDGTIIELRPDAILDKLLARVGKFKLQTKTFTMPGVEPGAIIEYRWREVNKSAFYLRLQFQRDVPIQVVKYYIKPLESDSYVMRVKTFNVKDPTFQQEPKGFRSTTMMNVPAFHPEPQMPPENEVRSWMLLYYSPAFAQSNFWNLVGKQVYEDVKSRMKVNDEVRKAAVTAIGDATGPDQKLERLFDFCHTRIRNVTDDASELTQSELAKLKENKSPADTLRRAVGTGYDINMLFAGLATAAGFDARFVKVGDRSDIFFDRNFADNYFLRAYHIAVRVGDQWRFFDPASTYVPYGMLRWQEEGGDALLSDPVNPTFVQTPISPPEKSLKKRIANLRLGEDGALEGTVRIEYTGHFASEQKEYYDQDSPAEREKSVRDGVKERMSTAEVSGIKLENLTDPAKPLVLSYQVRVPGYAERTGKRLFLQPAFFQYGLKPFFSAGERRHPIYFHYPWSEADTVTIELPVGFDLDNAEAPAPFSAGNLSQYDVHIRFDRSSRALVYNRDFLFGRGGYILFPSRGSKFSVQQVYEELKTLFDMLHERDSQTIALKQVVSASK